MLWQTPWCSIQGKLVTVTPLTADKFASQKQLKFLVCTWETHAMTKKKNHMPRFYLISEHWSMNEYRLMHNYYSLFSSHSFLFPPRQCIIMTSWGQFTVSLLMRALNRQQHRQGKPLNYYHCLSLACFLLPLMGYLWSLL